MSETPLLARLELEAQLDCYSCAGPALCAEAHLEIKALRSALTRIAQNPGLPRFVQATAVEALEAS